MAEGEKDNAAGGQASNSGSSKDLLFGWLVGRAAADLGLAHALAASEAQRVEQFKRLEDSLLAQIHELQNHAGFGAGADSQLASTPGLKTELDSFADRLTRLETMMQQATQSGDEFKTGVATLQSEINRQQEWLEAQRVGLQEIAGGLASRLHDLEAQFQTQAISPDGADSNLNNFKAELRTLADRVKQAEISTQQLHGQTTDEVERVREDAARLVKSEHTALKTEFFEHRQDLLALHSGVKQLGESFDKRFEDLRRELGENAIASVNAEIRGLRSEMESTVRKIESMPPSPAVLADFDGERAVWKKEADDIVKSGLRQLGNEIREELRNTAGNKVDHHDFNTELAALSARIENTEHAVQKHAARLGMELSTIQSRLSQQQERQQATDELLKRVEETLRTKFQEIQNYLVQQQGSVQQREARSTELNTEIQRLVQRIADVESTAHRAHALMINESQQTTQVRDKFRTELDDLRERLNERPSLAALVETVENNLNAKARDLQAQLAEKVLVVEGRENELREVKAQVQTITQKVLQLETPRPAPLESRSTESIVMPVDVSALRLASEDRPNAAPRLVVSSFGMQGGGAKDAVSQNDLAEGHKDQITQLHERISADIERARAELREKSGRWKVRR